MKNSYFLGVSLLVITILLSDMNLFVPNGKTLESREKILKNSKTKKYVYEIYKEIELHGYIISSVYGNKDGLAVFKENEGNYELQSVTYEEKGEVIIEQIMHKGESYYITICNQPNLDYAEVTYTINNQELEPVSYDVSKSNLISFKAPSDDFTMKIIYYDKDGNSFD